MFNETTFGALYQSAVAAFPLTTRRQHATGTIQISEVRATPYLGVRTLFFRSVADNSADNGGEYHPIIVFKNVTYHEGPGNGIVEITASDNGQVYYLNPVQWNANHVLVRCSCADYDWRFKHWNYLDRSNQGPDRKPYVAISDRGPVNPTASPGACKHLMKMAEHLQDIGILLA